MFTFNINHNQNTHLQSQCKKKNKFHVLGTGKIKDEAFNKLPLVQIYVKLSISTGEP